jgi:hypothetical protein
VKGRLSISFRVGKLEGSSLGIKLGISLDLNVGDGPTISGFFELPEPTLGVELGPNVGYAEVLGESLGPELGSVDGSADVLGKRLSVTLGS